jgi:hypothetical protein
MLTIKLKSAWPQPGVTPDNTGTYKPKLTDFAMLIRI